VSEVSWLLVIQKERNGIELFILKVSIRNRCGTRPPSSSFGRDYTTTGQYHSNESDICEKNNEKLATQTNCMNLPNNSIGMTFCNHILDVLPRVAALARILCNCAREA
jgi:hypothetical protein